MKRLRSRLRTALRGPVHSDARREGSHGLEQNKRYWDSYAGAWTPDFRGYEQSTSDRPEAYRHLGDEWGSPEHVDEVLEDWIYPYLTPETIALEIGSGGGRIAARVAPRVKHLFCMDISVEMLKQLRLALGDRTNVTLMHVEDARFPTELTSTGLDFVYSFDVWVHLDLHTMWKYLQQIGTALRDGGAAFIHTTNLATAEGWRRFSSQERASLEGHYFVVPEMIHLLAGKAGLTVEKGSVEDPANFYLARDYLVILRK